MNLSMQIGRAAFALAVLAAVGASAIAQTDNDADAQAPSVAHNRLEIATASAANQAQRWVVASVRVGAPQEQVQERVPRVAVRERLSSVPRS